MQGENQHHRQQRQKFLDYKSLKSKIPYAPVGVGHWKGNRADAIAFPSSSENSRSQSLNQPEKPRVDEDYEVGFDGDNNEDDMDREVDKELDHIKELLRSYLERQVEQKLRNINIYNIGDTPRADVRSNASGDKFYKTEGNGKFSSGAGGRGSGGSGSNAEGEREDREEDFGMITKFYEPDEPRVDAEDDKEGADEDNEDGVDREAAEEFDRMMGLFISYLERDVVQRLGNINKYNIRDTPRADVRGNASGDKFYKTEGNEKFPSGAGGGGSSGSGNNAEGEREDREEDFRTIIKFYEPVEPRVDDEDDKEGADEDNEDDVGREAAEELIHIKELLRLYLERQVEQKLRNINIYNIWDTPGADVRGNASGDKFYKTEGNEKFPSGAGGGGSSGSGGNAEGEREDREEDFQTITKFYEPDEPRVDDEDDEGGTDEDNEDGVGREAAEEFDHIKELLGLYLVRQVVRKLCNINKYNIQYTPTIKAGGTHSKDNLKGYCHGKKVRRAGSRRTRAKKAMRKQREAVQPTFLLAGLKNHPSMYIRRCQKLPERHSALQDTWTSAFEVCSTAAVVYKRLLHEAGFGDFLRIQPFKIRSGGYTSTLVERYFSETHTLHLGTFEIGPTPLAWSMITGIRFGGDPLNPPDITPQECAELLGGIEEDFSFIKGKLDLNALCPSGLDFSKNPTDSDREWMFRRLIVYLVGSCFFSGADSMVPIRLVSAMRNIRKINQYDWGSATFSAFLRGMRQKTSECCGTFTGFYPFLLLWAYEHIPYMRPLTKSGADTFPLACRWDFKQIDVPAPNDFIWHRLELEYIEDEVNFDPYKELCKKKDFQREGALSQKRVAFLGLESWELYMGERNVRQFGGGIQIPCSPPAKRFCERSENFTIDHKLFLGENAWGFLEDEGRDYDEWFRTNSLGRIVTLDQFQGKILGGRLIELWLRLHRDGYKVISPQDLRTLQDGAKKWEDKYQIAEARLRKTLAESRNLREDVNYWKQVAMSLAAERYYQRSQALDAQASPMTSLAFFPSGTSLSHLEEMVPFPRGYMNPYPGDARNFL